MWVVEVLPRFKFWKVKIKLLNRLEYFDNILQTIWCWKDLAQEIAKCYLSSVEPLPSAKFWKKWRWLSWTEWNILIFVLRKHWYWQDLAQEIANWHFYRSRLCRAPNSEEVKMALSIELWKKLWWKFTYTLILTRCNQWDCQMIFGIGEGLDGGLEFSNQ